MQLVVVLEDRPPHKIVPVYEWNKGSGGRILFPEPVNKPRGIRPRSSASDSVSTRKTGARGRFRAPDPQRRRSHANRDARHGTSPFTPQRCTVGPRFSRLPQLTPANQCHALSLMSLNATIHLLIVYVVTVLVVNSRTHARSHAVFCWFGQFKLTLRVGWDINKRTLVKLLNKSMYLIYILFYIEAISL